nr:pseudouridine synthase [Nostoc flagelliforme]
MAREQDYTCVEFTPLTGRTHQLRVHAADARGLGVRDFQKLNYSILKRRDY